VKDLAPKLDEQASQRDQAYADALDQLGIILLELCFSETLEQQQFRKKWSAGNTDKEKAGFDFLAAKEWHRLVNEEAGLDYADAVDWCLWGHRSTTPDT